MKKRPVPEDSDDEEDYRRAPRARGGRQGQEPKSVFDRRDDREDDRRGSEEPTALTHRQPLLGRGNAKGLADFGETAGHIGGSMNQTRPARTMPIFPPTNGPPAADGVLPHRPPVTGRIAANRASQAPPRSKRTLFLEEEDERVYEEEPLVPMAAELASQDPGRSAEIEEASPARDMPYRARVQGHSTPKGSSTPYSTTDPGSGEVSYAPTPMTLPERLNILKQDNGRLTKTVNEFQESLTTYRNRISEMEKCSALLKEELAMEKAKECPECRYRGDGTVRRAVKGSKGKKHGVTKTKQTSLNIALEAAIKLDKTNVLGGKPVILVSSLHSPFACGVVIPIVNQLHLRPLRPDSHWINLSGARRSTKRIPAMQHWWLPKLQEVYEDNGSPIFTSNTTGDGGTVDELAARRPATATGRRLVGWVPKIPLTLAVRPVDEGGMIATPGVFGAQRGDDQFKAFSGEFCRILMMEDQACANFPAAEVESLVRLNQNHRPTQKKVKNLHTTCVRLEGA